MSNQTDTAPFFSLVVPIYKTEQYLEQCLSSIKNQSFQDFECIVVNDGSPGVELAKFTENQDADWQPQIDLSQVPQNKQAETIFQAICGQDSRFQYIYQENQGLSGARNTALKVIRGQWILNVDSDDWILPDYLQKWFLELKNQPPQTIKVFRLNRCYNEDYLWPVFYPKKITAANCLHTCVMGSFRWAMNNQIIKKYNLTYDERLGAGTKHPQAIAPTYEDYRFAYLYVDALERSEHKPIVTLIDNPGYQYRNIDQEKKRSDPVLIWSNYKIAKVFQKEYLAHPNWKIKITGLILPYWHWLKAKNHPITLLLRKPISLFLRLLTDCY